ncbi:AAEL001997-PA [Aedes aegypti]|uniref:AAEL001997-PA n=1 Tax=Aedes aegypti TaxID=7159 RepID=Q17JM7_AEDAE|nr:AAEL001997-PA [Aedes aegypti]
MTKIKRKATVPEPKPQQQQADDDSGSDYEVDRHMTLTRAPKTVAEEFPLPKQVRKDVVKRGTVAQDVSEDESSEEEEDDEDVNLPTLTKAQIAEILQTIKNNKRLVLNVSNVNFSTSKEEIEEHFRKAGRVKGVRIPKKRASGFAFVEMLDAEGFQKAFLLHGSFLDGRQIRVQLSESGKKKSHQKILLLEKKNAEIRKMRKKNRAKPEAKEVTLVPKVQPKVVERDPYLDKKKTKPPTKKEIKAYKKKVSLKAKFRNVAMKGIKV